MDMHIFFTAVVLHILNGFFSVKGTHLNITTILQEPYLVEASRSNGVPIYRGYIKDLLDKLSEDAGFTYTLFPAADGEFGTEKPDGNWTGTINDILSGRADMIAAPLTVTSKRLQVIDFSQPFQIGNLGMVLRRPENSRQPVGDRLKRIWVPFESSVWFLTLAAYFVTSSAIYVISYFNPYDWRRMARDGEATIRESESFTCMNSFWFSISALALQGYVRTPRSLGARIVVTSWWMFVIVFVSCYISKLTSLLQIRPNEEEIAGYMKLQGLEDVVENNIKFVVIRGTALEEFIRNNNQQQYIKDLKRELVGGGIGGFVSNINDGMDELTNYPAGMKVFITESLMVQYQMQKYGCQFYFVNENILKRQYSLGFPKNSSRTQFIGRYILQYHEQGFIASLHKKWFSGSCRHYIYDGSDVKYKIPDFHSLDTASFSGALIILGIGLLIGVIVTVVESIVFKWAESGEDPHHHGRISTPVGHEVSTSLIDHSKNKTDTQV